MTKPKMRIRHDVIVTVRVTKKERELLGSIAEANGVSVSDAVRMCIKRATKGGATLEGLL